MEVTRLARSERLRMYEHKTKDGAPFTIYGLVCPLTRAVRYVGQTSTTLQQRTQNHSPSHFKPGPMRDWLESLGENSPDVVVLETGTNRNVRLKSSFRRESKGACGMRWARVNVWYSTVRETLWQKRFRRTLFNDAPLESLEVAALLLNPPLPWDKRT